MDDLSALVKRIEKLYTSWQASTTILDAMMFANAAREYWPAIRAALAPAQEPEVEVLCKVLDEMDSAGPWEQTKILEARDSLRALSAALRAALTPQVDPLDEDNTPYTTERLARWLDAKFARHREIEDQYAAQRLRALSASLKAAEAERDGEYQRANKMCVKLCEKIAELTAEREKRDWLERKAQDGEVWSAKLVAMTKWLDDNRPDVWTHGLCDAIIDAQNKALFARAQTGGPHE